MPGFTLQERKIAYIPIDQLVLSQRNVRTTEPPIDDLVGSIRAHGLLKNLVVVAGKKEHEVVAGGRRLRALHQLQKDGQLPAGLEEVPCLVLPPDADSSEISLAENVGHNPMHPADEYTAFAALQANGLSEEEIGARFGKSPLYVQQRLRLGNIAPSLMKLFREDKIQLSQLMALALTDDHDTQEKVWKAARAEWQREPRQLRSAIAAKELSVKTDRIGKFLGVADYENGGGSPRKDLFGGPDDVYLPDVKLARALANEKLAKHAKKVREDGWLWVETRLEFDHEDARRDKLVTYNGLPLYSCGKATGWPEKAKHYAGAIVTIGDNGKVEIYHGLLKPADAKRLSDDAKKAAPSKKKAATEAKPLKQAGELSFAAVQRLQGARTAVLQLELARKPRVALAALAADLARELDWGGFGYSDQRVIEIVPHRQNTNPNVHAGLNEHPAAEEMDQLEQAWIKRLKPGNGDLFGWLLQQPESLTTELLSFLTARHVMAAESFDRTNDRGVAFAAAAGVDMAQHWTPTEEWLASQPKGVIMAAVTEACGKKAAAELEKLKKGEAARRAAAMLEGKGWLPAPLRAPAPKKAAKKKAKKAAA